MAPRDPLHGVTLEALLQALVDRYGFEELGRRVPVRCFLNEPSVGSSLKFLRKTPWARAEVEALYVDDARKSARNQKRNQRRAERRALARPPAERPGTLAFTWPAGAEVPVPAVSSGYSLRSGEDRESFCAVQRLIGFQVTETLWGAMTLVPGAMVVAFGAHGPVAVGAAEQREHGWVELGWVAVAPDHRGRGLGRAVCGLLVGFLVDQGHTRIFGSTQDERIEALRIYLSLGFEPLESAENSERWAAVRERV